MARLPKPLRQVSNKTYTLDVFLIEVCYQTSTWSSSWEWDTFHDLRDVPPKVGTFHRKTGEFNTFNADLVSQALMEEDQGYASWRPKLLDNRIAFDTEHFIVAREYAQRLRDFGRFAHDLTRPLPVRLVRKQVAHLVREYPI